ncbi:hypothetical protein [Paracoccus sp. (in: a-proteobacteria)]|uniref:hypothetical protein n=1 Tax=Paracoccus sp. TaxID=267 RepID=UPI002AFE8B74|nr:hypothetical protein [Paracoccus sp. (in: a-proteobacteria)]
MADDIYPWTGNFNDLAPDDQRTVAQLVVRGKAVAGTVDDLLARLKRTRCVALLREVGTDRIVAVAALKQPVATYRRGNFTKACVPIAGFEAALELGYVVIALDMQGKQLSGRLVTAIAEKMTGPTFATTDSNTMRNNLERSGFTRVGDEWQGKKGLLSLWTITP